MFVANERRRIFCGDWTPDRRCGYTTAMTEPCPYVSRGGLKLAAALDAFDLDVTNFVCVDLGCNVGGFTDCLLQRGASRIFAIDTGYGQLAWKLRNDPRVSVHERTNALHCDVAAILRGDSPQRPQRSRREDEIKKTEARKSKTVSPSDSSAHSAASAVNISLDLAVIDLAWTRQRHAIPAALRWRPRHIITLIKPHYEAGDKTDHRGVLAEADAETVLRRVLDEMPSLGVRVMNHIRSPILGGAGKGRKGNIEYLAWVKPVNF
ncbi:MAG: SAM-dependent methyltransferase [Phycisphaerales bacterium]